MVTLVLLLLTEATTERKQTLAWTNTIPQTTECRKLFQKNVILHQDTCKYVASKPMQKSATPFLMNLHKPRSYLSTHTGYRSGEKEEKLRPQMSLVIHIV